MGAVIDISQTEPKLDVTLLRLTLHKPEVYQVPPAASDVRVISGTAWVTQDGEDYLLQTGESMRVASELISPTGDQPLILEIELPSSLSYEELTARLTQIGGIRRARTLTL